ncbi:MAG: TIGR00282 family metallophosphoesterase [Spirochaetales bacterium]
MGKAGVFCVKTLLPALRKEREIDFVIANGDSVTGGFGLGKNHSIYLRKLGIDVLTGGECIYYKRDMVDHIQHVPYILRPANYPPGNPGRGYGFYTVRNQKIAVVSLLGQSGFNRVHLSNPYSLLTQLVGRIRETTPCIVVDFHATTTAEKYSLFFHADGMVSAVVGSHMKVLTADARILPRGTAVICGGGRTGSLNSVGGLDPEIEIRKFLTQIPERSKDAWDTLELQGVVLDIEETGKARSIEAIRVPCREVPDERNRDGDKDRG